MSYDLGFWTSPGVEVDHEAVAAYFERLAHCKVEKQARNDFEAIYENPDTRVYWVVDRLPEPEDEDAPRFPGFTATGLSFHLNFLRPTWFGMESFPQIVEFARTLDFWAAEPGAQPRRPDAEALLESWKSFNDRVAQHEAERVPKLERSKSLEMWSYNRLVAQLQADPQRLTDAAYVPHILPIRKKDAIEIYRAVAWNGNIPQIFPEVDYIIVGKAKKSFLGSIIGARPEFDYLLAPWLDVVRILGDQLESFESNDLQLKLLGEHSVRYAQKAIAKVEAQPMTNYIVENQSMFVD
jgi:hypothetical protein